MCNAISLPGIPLRRFPISGADLQAITNLTDPEIQTSLDQLN